MSLIGAALTSEKGAIRGTEFLNEPFARDIMRMVRTGVRRVAVKGIRGFFKKHTPVRPGIGSAVTKGKLQLGKGQSFSARPGIGSNILRLGGGAAAAVGIGTVASHRQTTRQTQPMPQPSRAPTPRPTARDTKLCCPQGTVRKVCFKRGRVKPRKRKFRDRVDEYGPPGEARRQGLKPLKRKRKFSAKQLANQRRFAAAARARRKKGR